MSSERSPRSRLSLSLRHRARRRACPDGIERAGEEALQRDVVGRIFGTVPLCRKVRPHAARVLIECVAGTECGQAAALTKLAGPVLALELLDGRAISAGEGAKVGGIHDGGV